MITIDNKKKRAILAAVSLYLEKEQESKKVKTKNTWTANGRKIQMKNNIHVQSRGKVR